MRIVFMGTPDFSVPVLKALVGAEYEVAAVYCQPPRPAGRGKKEKPSPVHAAALKLGLDVRHPANFKNSIEVSEFSALKADAAVVVAYGLILPQSLLDAPAHGCLNIHASLLPRWRGAAPIHRAIMAGDANTGVCIMQMEAGLDTGPVLMRRETRISSDDTMLKLHGRLSEMGAEAIVEALENLEALSPENQASEGVTYANKIDKAEARINWTDSAEVVDRKIRGLSPFPGAWCEASGERLKILDSCVAEGQGEPGEVLDAELTIACGSGTVGLKSLQRAGRSAMVPEVFLRGFDLPPDSRLT